MNALLLWILGILGVLILLWGLTRLQGGGLAWAGFGLLLGIAGLGGAWLHQLYGTPVFWGLGVLGVLLLVWALLNLSSRLAGWVASLAVLLALTGFGSIALLNSSSPNPLNNFQTGPSTPNNSTTAPTPAETPAPSPLPAPEAGPASPSPSPEPPPPATSPTPPATLGSLREVEASCPCLLNVRVKAPNPTVRILQGSTEIASSRLERSSFLLEAGEYTLQVEAPGYRTFSALINVPNNKNLEVELAQQ